MKIKKSTLISAAAVVLVFAGAFGMSYLAGGLRLTDADAKKAVTGASAVKAEDIQDENGKFVILDYPEDLDMSSYVTISDYEGMEVATEKPGEITDELIQQNIDSFISYYGKYDVHTEGTVEKGDIVTISYTGYQDGVAVAAYTAKDNVLKLGSSDIPAEFEEHLVGTPIGKEQSFTVTFPEDWDDTAYAGRTMDFKATVSAVNEIPEVTDDNVGEITDGKYQTKADFLAYIEQSIKDYEQQQYEAEVGSEILEKLMDQAKFGTVPQELLTWHVSTQMRYYQDMADQYNMTVEEYLQDAGLADSVDDALYAMTQSAVEACKSYGLLDVIADQQGITVDPETDAADIEERSQQLIEGLGLSGQEKLLDYYGEVNLYHDVQNWKVFDWLRDHVTQTR